MVTVVLADDHVVVRQGLRALLESDPRVVIVGEAADGLEAVELVRRRKPTVLITDLMMPGLDGLAITRKLARLKSDTRVIILSMYGDQAYVLTALKSGAAGYVVRHSPVYRIPPGLPRDKTGELGREFRGNPRRLRGRLWTLMVNIRNGELGMLSSRE